MAHILLTDLLDHLEQDELKRFRFYLIDQTLEGFKPISRGHLPKCEHYDVTYIVEKMMAAYGDERALKMTMHILGKIPRNDLVQMMEREMEKR